MTTPEDMTSESFQKAIDKATRTMIDSKSDERIVNNVMRHEYKKLNDTEKEQMQRLKDMGAEFFNYCNQLGSSRELSLAMTKIEEAVMWSVKHVTK